MFEILKKIKELQETKYNQLKYNEEEHIYVVSEHIKISKGNKNLTNIQENKELNRHKVDNN